MSRGRRGRARRGSRFDRAGDLLLALLILAGIFLVTERAQRTSRQSLVGVATVNDGDTLTLAGERIRLEGIDAPEFSQTCRREGLDYPCGRQARSALQSLLADGRVACEGYERDRYDRLLARCNVNGKDVSEAIVNQGWAVAYGDYENSEVAARRARRGLWAGEFEEPRDWRERNAGPADVASGEGANWFLSLVDGVRDGVRRMFAAWQ